jgi:hypothetical protein
MLFFFGLFTKSTENVGIIPPPPVFIKQSEKEAINF